jgi:hypothetical protein
MYDIYPYPKCLEPRRSQILRCLHIHNEIPWGGDSSLNTKYIYVSCIPYTHSLKIILYKIFSNFEYEAKLNSVGFFLPAALYWCLKKSES